MKFPEPTKAEWADIAAAMRVDGDLVDFLGGAAAYGIWLRKKMPEPGVSQVELDVLLECADVVREYAAAAGLRDDTSPTRVAKHLQLVGRLRRVPPSEPPIDSVSDCPHFSGRWGTEYRWRGGRPRWTYTAQDAPDIHHCHHPGNPDKSEGKCSFTSCPLANRRPRFKEGAQVLIRAGAGTEAVLTNCRWGRNLTTGSFFYWTDRLTGNEYMEDELDPITPTPKKTDAKGDPT